ncbi:BatD family protein [Grimontia kaedaensis]|nr:BatD family protein [Grimontia kaedaensis]
MTRLTSLAPYRRTGAFLLGLVLLLASGSALAASAEATVSQNVVPVGEAFQLTVSVDDSVDNEALDLSPLDTDFIYGRPSVSSNTSIINGSMTRSTVWRVAVAAKKMGTFTLPSLDIEGMKTEPITIRAVEARDKSAAQDTETVKLTATLDRNAGYVGETFNYRVRLMIGTQLDSPALQAPFGDGLEVKQVGEDVQAEAVVNGRRYVVISRLYQVTPAKAGQLTLEGAVFSASEVKGRRGWGPSLGVPIARQAEYMTLDIKEKPSDYTGLWLPTPSLELTQSWQPDAISEPLGIEVGEAINREITLKIKNIEQSAMPDIAIDYPQSVRVYADKPEYSRDGDYTVMTLKQVIIPREAGTVILPALSINWFNTISGQKQTSEIAGLQLDVKPGSAVTAPLPQTPDVSAPQTVTTAPTTAATVVKDAGIWPWATGIFALLWLGTLVLYVRKRPVLKVKESAAPSRNVAESPLQSVIEAVNANDTVRVAAAMRVWDRSVLPDTLNAQIDEEVSAMMASRYAPSSSVWKNTQLLALLKKAGEEGKAKRLSRPRHLTELL